MLRYLIVLLVSVGLGGIVSAQSISGNIVVTPNVNYNYTFVDGPQENVWWTITGGTIVSGQGTLQVTISWPPGCNPGYIYVEGEGFSAETEVTIVMTTPGSIFPASQTIGVGQTGATLQCSAFQDYGGNNNFTYYWEYSYDGVNWIDAGVSGTSFSPGIVTQTTWYHLYVLSDCNYIYSEPVVINIAPPLGTPTNASATTSATRQITVQWQDNTNSEGNYEVYRSGISNTNYQLIATLPANTVSYLDNNVVGNTRYYYKVRAISSNSNSGYSNETDATTGNTNPAIGNIADISLYYISSVTIPVNASDIDNEAIVIAVTNLPSFASYVYLGNNAGEIHINSNSINHIGTYTINIAVTDGHSGVTNKSVMLVVSANHPPILQSPVNLTVQEHDEQTVNISATDLESITNAVWTVQGLPPFAAYTQTASGSVQLVIKPTHGTSRVYPVMVKVMDAGGAWDQKTFNITIVPKLLVAGQISYDQQLNLLTSKPTIGGVCSDYAYQWQRTIAGSNDPYEDVFRATSRNILPHTQGTAYDYRLKVSCGSEIVYSNVLAVGSYIPVVSTQNVIRTFEFNRSGVQAASDAVDNAGIQEVKESFEYFDGLGRPKQQVAKKGSMVSGMDARDYVTTNVYDEFGREPLKHLPFAANGQGSTVPLTDGSFKSDHLFQQQNFYNDPNGVLKGQVESHFYTKTNFEASPMNQVVSTYAPGTSWAGSESNPNQANRRGAQQGYYTNTANDAVRIWRINENPLAGQLASYASNSGDVYPAGRLYKSIKADEHGKQLIEFKDLDGHIVLRKMQLTASSDDGTGRDHEGWLCTYYIYDRNANLRCVIQPAGVKLLDENNWNTAFQNNVILNDHCFRYEYDQRNRVIVKKLPGGGEVQMVYDTRDNLVMKQDANLRLNQQWEYVQYDIFNRAVATGLLKDLAHFGDPTYHRTQSAASLDYPNLSQFTDVEELTKTFYDNYDWLNNYSTSFSSNRNTSFDNHLSAAYNQNRAFADPIEQTYVVNNLVTGRRIKVLSSVNDYLYAINYYDVKGRIIQTQTSNITGGIDVLTNLYNYNGAVLASVFKQQNATNPQTHVVLTETEFDALWRVNAIAKTVTSTIGNNAIVKPRQIIVRNEYDALGQLKTKTLGNSSNMNDGLQKMQMEYNIRGWLTGINKDELQDGASQVNSYYAMELGYDKAAAKAVSTSFIPQFNGNIGGMIWKGRGDRVRRQYDFTYDAASRLLKADFKQDDNGNTWSTGKMDYSVKLGNGTDPFTAYDANGNIQEMLQKGWKTGNGQAEIDKLVYNYKENDLSNRLREVTDNSGNTDPLGDFSDANNNGSDDYAYDDNGNLVMDKNKRIDQVTYNHLNRSVLITVKNANNSTKGTIQYVYDGDGNKLKKIVVDYSTPGKTVTSITAYISGFVYESRTTVPSDPASPDFTDVLRFVTHEEGRLRYEQASPLTCPSENQLVYDYFVKDHLGNTRIVLTDEQRNVCYPVLSFDGDAAGIQQQNNNWEKGDGTAMNVTTERQVWPSSFIAQYGNQPGDPNGQYAILLKKSTRSVGAGKLLKVMAGDRIHTSADYYYEVINADNSGADGVQSMVTSLLAALTGNPAAGVYKNQASSITGLLQNNPDVIDFFQQQQPSTGTDEAPKAYLNVLFFDDQFVLDKQNSRSFPVGTTVNQRGSIDKRFSNAIEAVKSGYAYVYISNESESDVYFDNFYLTHQQGPLVEETHYYPFGLTMAAISSAAFRSDYAENKKKYNGIEKEDGLGIEMYDAQLRELDPQIGRWWQIDPKTENMEMWSPYASNYDNPIRYSDPLGDEGAACCQLLMEIFTDVVDATVETGKGLYNGAIDVSRFINTYINPLTPVVEYITEGSVESDFSEYKSRRISGVEAAIAFIPGSRLEAKLIERAAQTAAVKTVETAATKTSTIAANMAMGKEGERIVNNTLDMAAAENGEKVIHQVYGKFANGDKIVYDNIIIDAKSGMIKWTNETKTGNAVLSEAQKRAQAGEPVTLTSKKLPKELKNTTISSTTTPYKVTRLTYDEVFSGKFATQ